MDPSLEVMHRELLERRTLVTELLWENEQAFHALKDRQSEFRDYDGTEEEQALRAAYRRLRDGGRDPAILVLSDDRDEILERIRHRTDEIAQTAGVGRYLEMLAQHLPYDADREAVLADRRAEEESRAEQDLERAREELSAFSNLLQLWETDRRMVLQAAETAMEEWISSIRAHTERIAEAVETRRRLNDRTLAALQFAEEAAPPRLRELRLLLRTVWDIIPEANGYSIALADYEQEGIELTDEETALMERQAGLHREYLKPLFSLVGERSDAEIVSAREFLDRYGNVDDREAAEARVEEAVTAGYRFGDDLERDESVEQLVARLEGVRGRSETVLRLRGLLNEDPKFYYAGAVSEAEELLDACRASRDDLAAALAARRAEMGESEE